MSTTISPSCSRLSWLHRLHGLLVCPPYRWWSPDLQKGLAVPGHGPSTLEHGVIESSKVPFHGFRVPQQRSSDCTYCDRRIYASRTVRDTAVHSTIRCIIGSGAMVLWAIIQIDHQGGDVGGATTPPPLGEAIYETVTGHFRGHAVTQFVQRRQEMPTGVTVASGWNRGRQPDLPRVFPPRARDQL